VETVISTNALRIVIAVIGVVILAAIYFFGRPRQPGQGRRVLFRRGRDERIEPVIGDSGAAAPETASRQGHLDIAMDRELDRLGATVAAARGAPAAQTPARPAPGRRPRDLPVERIVTLYLVARHGGHFRGSDIAVAAEKAGLKFGDMHIFHRLVDGRPDAGPIFSMANMVKPGYFDMNRIGELTTPGLTFFITLPGPLSALDAWDTLLPAAQRIAELLDGNLLDEDRNALGHQRIAVLRDELRAWDRRHEGTGPEIRMPPLR